MAATRYEKEGRIAIFTINRPEKLNAMNSEVFRNLHDALVDMRDDPEVWVGIITGAGEKAFCAGADIKDMLPFMKENLRDRPWAAPANHMRGLDIWKPLIAAINGVALGGGLEIALACDIRIASENARLGTPEVTLGIMPGWGGTQRLPRIIPWAKAAEILLMGNPVNAEEAYRIGLVNKVVLPEDLEGAVMEMAQKIVSKFPLSIKLTRACVDQGFEMSLSAALESEIEAACTSYASGERQVGMKATMKKK